MIHLSKRLAFLSMIVFCTAKLIDKEAAIGHNNLAHSNKSSDLNHGAFRPMKHATFKRPKRPLMKLPTKMKNTPSALSSPDMPQNISALPTTGVFDHTHRPGTVQWTVPKLTFREARNENEIVLGPIYRLPLDNDDTGAQIDLKWTYANLKVRPEAITIEAVGPNKATWAVSVVEGTATTATWNLRATPSYSPLIEGYYTLHVYDQRGHNTPPKPGWLLPDNNMKIALYKTEDNHIGEKIAPFECATCFKYVMKDVERVEDGSSRFCVNYGLVLIISFFWTLL